LFDRPVRTFSSGCVRVEKPLELARYVIGRDDIESQQLQAIIDTGENQVISLPEPIPVYMVYQTAWVDTNGNAQFRDDIYARDPALAALVQRDVLPNSDTSYAGKLSVSAVLPSVK
jgi:murein L,D-transpeptidase YcbB/YkuD